LKKVNQGLPLKTYSGVLVLPIDDKGNVVLVSSPVGGTGDWLLAMPYGELKVGEIPEEGALRVLIKEAGYFSGQLEPLGIYRPKGGILEMIYLFVATELMSVKRHHDLSAGSQVFSLTPHGVSELIREGSFNQEAGIKAFTNFYLINHKE